MLTDMLQLICCPVCRKSELDVQIKKQDGEHILEGRLICKHCDTMFAISQGIPDFIPPKILNDTGWKTWQDHLIGLQKRREQRISQPNQLANRLGVSRPQKAFAKFADITQGKVLDIGCGPGKFRFHLNNEKIDYYGMDPIVLPEAENFPFVRAVAEYIPFKDNSFSHIVVISSIDHFNDLDAFFREAIRILNPTGKLHIVQSIHGISGPLSIVKKLAHEIKDAFEDRVTKINDPETPKHITEFSKSSLHETMKNYFHIDSTYEYSQKWYSPNKMFISATPNAVSNNAVSNQESEFRIVQGSQNSRL